MKKNSKGKYGKDKAILIKNSAINSIGTDSDATCFELSQTIEMINFYSSKIDALDDKIKEILLLLDSVLLSIPGISYTLASIILAEVGDINGFNNSSQLQPFAGLDPALINLVNL